MDNPKSFNFKRCNLCELFSSKYCKYFTSPVYFDSILSFFIYLYQRCIYYNQGRQTIRGGGLIYPCVGQNGLLKVGYPGLNLPRNSVQELASKRRFKGPNPHQKTEISPPPRCTTPLFRPD